MSPNTKPKLSKSISDPGGYIMAEKRLGIVAKCPTNESPHDWSHNLLRHQRQRCSLCKHERPENLFGKQYGEN